MRWPFKKPLLRLELRDSHSVRHVRFVLAVPDRDALDLCIETVQEALAQLKALRDA